MTIQECYAQLQGDYEDVLARLRTDQIGRASGRERV